MTPAVTAASLLWYFPLKSSSCDFVWNVLHPISGLLCFIGHLSNKAELLSKEFRNRKDFVHTDGHIKPWTVVDEELYNLYPPPNVFQVIKSWRMTWAGHVGRIGGRRGAARVLVARREGKRPLEYPGKDGRIILKWTLKTWDGVMDWIDMAQDRDRWRAVVMQ
jgi:hypothetical protein